MEFFFNSNFKVLSLSLNGESDCYLSPLPLLLQCLSFKTRDSDYERAASSVIPIDVLHPTLIQTGASVPRDRHRVSHGHHHHLCQGPFTFACKVQIHTHRHSKLITSPTIFCLSVKLKLFEKKNIIIFLFKPKK